MKVRLQTTQNYTGALDAATKIYKNEGASAFYKGTLTPLIGIGACVSFKSISFPQHLVPTCVAPMRTSNYLRCLSNLLDSTTPDVYLQNKTLPNSAALTCLIPNTTHQGPLPESPTLFSHLLSNISASDYKPNRMGQRVSTPVPSIA